MVALFVVLTFIVFLLVDFIVLKAQKKEHPAFVSLSVFNKGSIILPAGYFLSKGHTWITKVKGDLVRMGVDDFILKAFKSLTVTPVKKEGDKIKAGEAIFEAKSGNHTVSLRSPVSGEITGINRNLAEKLISDPYDLDWLIQVQPDSFSNEIISLKTGEAAVNWLKSEFTRFKDFVHAQSSVPELAGVTMADGGNIVEGVLKNFEDNTIRKFEEQFLSL